MHPRLGEEAGQGLAQRPPVLDDVAHAGRDAQVVLEHPELTRLVADQVDAADVHPHPVGRFDAGRLPVEVGAGEHEPPGHHAVGEHLAGSVDVGQEPLQRVHPLPHRPGERVPLGRVEDARNQVQRERPLLAGVGEGDSAVGEDPGELVGAGAQIGNGERLQRGEQRPVRRPRLARPLEHLVPGVRHRVLIEDVRHVRILVSTAFPSHYLGERSSKSITKRNLPGCGERYGA